MELEKYKQLLKIMAEEINVKKVTVDIPILTERGRLSLEYNLELDELYWALDGSRVLTKTPKLDSAIPDILTNL